MRKAAYILAAALLTASCSLDHFPYDEVSSGDMVSTDNAVVATNGNYALFKGHISHDGFNTVGNTYIRHYQQLAELKSDNILMSGKSTDPLFSDATMTEMEADTNLDYFWWISYKIAYSTSSLINVIPDDADATLRHIKGENLFLRALSHMNLIQIFAFPYAQNPEGLGVVKQIGDGSPVQRLTVREIYDQVEDDLKKAISLMEGGVRRGNNGYVDVNAAKALLCRLYLYENRDDECITLADELLGGSPDAHLESDVEYMFQHTKDSKEVLWCVALIDDIDTDYFGAQAMLGSMFYSQGDPGDGTGWAEIYWSQSLIDLFERYPADQRLTKLRVKQNVSTNGKKMIYYPWVNGDGFAENHIDRAPVRSGDSWTMTARDGKTYPVKTETVHTYPRTYIDLPEGKTYVTVADSMGCREGTGGNIYPLNYMKKYSNQDGIPSNLASPAYLRYAEVILNRAEAYAHKGQTAEALSDVNVIRTRAGIPTEGLFTAANMKERGYDDVLDVVLDERRLELCFEGFRVLDLMRNARKLDRRYAGRHPYQVYEPDSPALIYWIPLKEITASGIPQNNKY